MRVISSFQRASAEAAAGGSGGGGGNAGGGSSRLSHYKIIDMEDGSYFEFHALPESGFGINKSANWNATQIPGRSSPIQGFGGSDPATISMSIPIVVSIEATDNRSPQLVKQMCDWFRSMPYPDYRRGIAPPHRFNVIMAGQFKLVCVAQSVDVQYVGPFDVGSGLTHMATATVSFIEVDDTPKDLYEVRAG